MGITNVELSKNELELVTNTEFILTKNRIIQKVYELFGALSEVYKSKLNAYANTLPVDIFSIAPKISKGENYRGLPYIMLDYPRIFSKNDVFAIRSFFWWGKLFSITLQLSGKYMELHKSSLLRNLPNLKEQDFFTGINESQWEHHFEESNYKSVKEIDAYDEILNKPFIKIAKQHSLSEWNNATEFFEESFGEYLRLLV